MILNYNCIVCEELGCTTEHSDRYRCINCECNSVFECHSHCAINGKCIECNECTLNRNKIIVGNFDIAHYIINQYIIKQNLHPTFIATL